MFDLEVNYSRANMRLRNMSPRVRERLYVAVNANSFKLKELTETRAAQRLQMRTGKFVAGIKNRVVEKDNSITASVWNSAKTAALFEYGGTTPPHYIEAKDAAALMLQVRTGIIFRTSVVHPGGKYQPLQILHSAFGEMKPQILRDMEDAVAGAAAEASDE
jgi:hypothetical protein